MDLNCYAIEKLIEARLAELRAASARSALFESLRPKGHGARVALGEVLVRAGRWLLRDDAVVERVGGLVGRARNS
jgi:hypothetical protein